jgi:hypothetical protein
VPAEPEGPRLFEDSAAMGCRTPLPHAGCVTCCGVPEHIECELVPRTRPVVRGTSFPVEELAVS